MPNNQSLIAYKPHLLKYTSPIARETANWPFTRETPPHSWTYPPAVSTRNFSSSLSGWWSLVNSSTIKYASPLEAINLMLSRYLEGKAAPLRLRSLYNLNKLAEIKDHKIYKLYHITLQQQLWPLQICNSFSDMQEYYTINRSCRTLKINHE